VADRNYLKGNGQNLYNRKGVEKILEDSDHDISKCDIRKDTLVEEPGGGAKPEPFNLKTSIP
jgi:hypothetical protein